jgi:bifunctional DNA-binding transcriptional regulator/antitoxin component of YhaV-PrlF toxin-antitoxin module
VIPKIIREIVDFREGEPVHIEPLPDNSGVIIRKIKEDSLTDEP